LRHCHSDVGRLHLHKHGVTSLTKCFSLDGRKNDIAASPIDIGNALTDHAGSMTNGEPLMYMKHAGDPVLHMPNPPLDVNVQFTTIVATKMPFVARGSMPHAVTDDGAML